MAAAEPGTFTLFVLNHDSVAKGEQLEELRDVLVFPGSDTGHQGVIHELEFFVSEPIPAPVHRLGGKREKDNEDMPSFVVLLIFSEFWRLQGKL